MYPTGCRIGPNYYPSECHKSFISRTQVKQGTSSENIKTRSNTISSSVQSIPYVQKFNLKPSVSGSLESFSIMPTSRAKLKRKGATGASGGANLRGQSPINITEIDPMREREKINLEEEYAKIMKHSGPYSYKKNIKTKNLPENQRCKNGYGTQETQDSQSLSPTGHVRSKAGRTTLPSENTKSLHITPSSLFHISSIKSNNVRKSGCDSEVGKHCFTSTVPTNNQAMKNDVNKMNSTFNRSAEENNQKEKTTFNIEATKGIPMSASFAPLFRSNAGSNDTKLNKLSQVKSGTSDYKSVFMLSYSPMGKRNQVENTGIKDTQSTPMLSFTSTSYNNIQPLNMNNVKDIKSGTNDTKDTFSTIDNKEYDIRNILNKKSSLSLLLKKSAHASAIPIINKSSLRNCGKQNCSCHKQFHFRADNHKFINNKNSGPPDVVEEVDEFDGCNDKPRHTHTYTHGRRCSDKRSTGGGSIANNHFPMYHPSHKMEVINEETECEDDDCDCGGNLSNTSQVGGKTERKPIEDCCADFLNIVHDNILESVQKSVIGVMRKYSAHTMEQVQALYHKVEKHEIKLEKICNSLMEKINEQTDNNLKQFKTIIQFINQLSDRTNEEQHSCCQEVKVQPNFKQPQGITCERRGKREENKPYFHLSLKDLEGENMNRKMGGAVSNQDETELQVHAKHYSTIGLQCSILPKMGERRNYQQNNQQVDGSNISTEFCKREVKENPDSNNCSFEELSCPENLEALFSSVEKRRESTKRKKVQNFSHKRDGSLENSESFEQIDQISEIRSIPVTVRKNVCCDKSNENNDDYDTSGYASEPDEIADNYNDNCFKKRDDYNNISKHIPHLSQSEPPDIVNKFNNNTTFHQKKDYFHINIPLTQRISEDDLLGLHVQDNNGIKEECSCSQKSERRVEFCDCPEQF